MEMPTNTDDERRVTIDMFILPYKDELVESSFAAAGEPMFSLQVKRRSTGLPSARRNGRPV